MAGWIWRLYHATEDGRLFNHSEHLSSFERKFTLYEEGDTTRVRDEWKLDTGRAAIRERLARGRVKSAVAENLEAIS